MFSLLPHLLPHNHHTLLPLLQLQMTMNHTHLMVEVAGRVPLMAVDPVREAQHHPILTLPHPPLTSHPLLLKLPMTIPQIKTLLFPQRKQREAVVP